MQPTAMNAKFAEFVGILLGDGSLGRYGSQYRIKITTNANEKEYHSHILQLIENLFGIKALKRKRKGEDTVDILIFKKDLFNFLTNFIGLKIAPKKNRAIIPKIFINTKLEIDILRGYFDSDGCVAIVNNNGTKYPRIEMKICQSPMQKQFINIIKKLGFRFGCYQIENGAVRIQINGKEQLKKWNNIVRFSNSKNIVRYQQFNC